MRYFPLLSLLTAVACGESGPAASGRLEAGGAGGQASADASGTAGAAGGSAGNPATMETVAEAGAAGTPGTADAGTEVAAEVAPPVTSISVTWTFKVCMDNAVSIGVTDQTTGKGLAGPVTAKKPVGDVFTLVPVQFQCADGDIVCWSASDKEGMCGACVDKAMPVIGC